jgi:hypothetical protein
MHTLLFAFLDELLFVFSTELFVPRCAAPPLPTHRELSRGHASCDPRWRADCRASMGSKAHASVSTPRAPPHAHREEGVPRVVC